MKWRLKTEFSNHQICSVYYSNNHRSQIIKYLSLSSTAHIYVNQCQVTQRLESVMSCNTSLLAESIMSRNTSPLGKRKCQQQKSNHSKNPSEWQATSLAVMKYILYSFSPKERSLLPSNVARGVAKLFEVWNRFQKLFLIILYLNYIYNDRST